MVGCSLNKSVAVATASLALCPGELDGFDTVGHQSLLGLYHGKQRLA